MRSFGKLEKWVKGTPIPSFLSRSHARSHAGDVCVYARAYACRVVSYARVRAAITQYRQVMRGARPILIPFIALLLPSHSPRISIFSPSRRHSGRDASAPYGETTPPAARKRQNRKAHEKTRRELRDHEKSRNIATSFISSRESGKRRIFGFSKMFHHNFHCFRHKNARVACSRNDDVSNFALYIPTDVTLLS